MIFKRGAVEPAQMQGRPRFATGLVRLTALAALLSATGCVEAVSAVSDGPVHAATKVDQLGEALAARFTNPERSGQFETARRRLVAGALNPSSAFDDTVAWTAIVPPATRILSAHGTLTELGYRFDVAPATAPLKKLGDTRHVVTLRRLSDGEYRWSTGVDFAMGALTAADVASMLGQFLTAGHDREPVVVRSAAKVTFPQSAAVLSRLFAIDSLALRPGSQGTTAVHLTIGVHTETLRKTSPHFADYLAKYVENSRYRFSLADRTGALYFEATGANRKIHIRYRVKAGTLVSFLGPPRPLPDSLRLTSDLIMHVKVFDVGWKNLVTDFTISRTERSRSWMIVGRTEPEWHLPLITARLIRTPLRRPFQGAGASFEVAVIDSAGAQTILARRAYMEVKESAILRFLSSLVSRVFDDLDAAVEREEAAYIRDLTTAFRHDARLLLAK